MLNVQRRDFTEISRKFHQNLTLFSFKSNINFIKIATRFHRNLRKMSEKSCIKEQHLVKSFATNRILVKRKSQKRSAEKSVRLRIFIYDLSAFCSEKELKLLTRFQ